MPKYIEDNEYNRLLKGKKLKDSIPFEDIDIKRWPENSIPQSNTFINTNLYSSTNVITPSYLDIISNDYNMMNGTYVYSPTKYTNVLDTPYLVFNNTLNTSIEKKRPNSSSISPTKDKSIQYTSPKQKEKLKDDIDILAYSLEQDQNNDNFIETNSMMIMNRNDSNLLKLDLLSYDLYPKKVQSSQPIKIKKSSKFIPKLSIN